MRMRKMLLLAVIGILLIAQPVSSQAGRGALIEVNPLGVIGIGALNPLTCDNTACRRITDFLFPWLLGVDPVTGQSAPTDLALVRHWEPKPNGRTITFDLRDDLVWSDGEAVTAYDVLYSYLAIASEEFYSPYTGRVQRITAAVPQDDSTITFWYSEASCSMLDLHFPVIPAPPSFREMVGTTFDGFGDPLDQSDASNNLLNQFTSWRSTLPEGYFADAINEPPATAGLFQIDRIQPLDYIRLVRGDLGFEYIDPLPDRAAADRFLTGETNILVDPPFERRDDIRAASGIQVFEGSGLAWDYINFNLADPKEPRSAFDEDGAPLDQGHHPIFGDVRVRRAIQQAVDVDQLIAAALLGNGTVMPANQLPTSWAYNADLAPVAYDPMAAARALEEAGWKDWDGDGVRECVACLYAKEGTRLSFELLYSGTAGPYRDVVVSVLADQLRLVGIEIRLNGLPFGALLEHVRQQNYDAYLAGWTENYPINPDQTALFATPSDVIGEGLNTGSYSNPRVDELLLLADRLPGCDVAARTDLYREMQTILQADQPYVWLYVVNEMVAAQGGVQGFAPYAHAPFWNVETWTVTGGQP